MKRPAPAARSAVFLAGLLLTLPACSSGAEPGTETPAPVETATVTVSETVTPTTVSESSTAESPTTGEVSAFGRKIADLAQVDPAPYASRHIFPQQPGFQFTGPDGTYCEVYGQPEGVVEEVAAMCTHSGEGEINAVSVSGDQPATTHHVNRIFAPRDQTRILQPGTRLTAGAVACGVPEDGVAVTCALGAHGFTVSTQGVETG
ncbi:hypothetical protein [Corynebacterium halotolerans]|uniref:Secreted protein n=1 Tax=Corynebacterium halotolerans YIM 70093 = DSM 44683 TaxID=1121362 RepID=M1MX64_9CORY|nr:hypothetical protein [Corynebacterium halotolerans]AGF72354.1 hypothetical protein A605_06760 [Corynebacterium halotolerans YIM 70093 = DSM 44683]